MRSAELAALAGVTVRTLRHYHQIGLLPEPVRGSNGYRAYDVHDLLAVLRIRRLAALGIPLDRVGDALAADPDDGDATLAALDEELGAQIAKLEAQRATIAVLRRERARPDLPVDLARFAGMFTTTRASGAAEMDRELLILLSHLAGEGAGPSLGRWLERLLAVGTLDRARELQTSFDELPSDTPEPEREALAAEMLALYDPVLTDLASLPDVPFDPSATRLVDEYTRDRLNPAQGDVLRRIEAGFEEAARVAATG